jgi:hypothetical protein
VSKGSLRLVGGVQAEAVAHVVARIPTITDRYDVTGERSEESGANALVVDGKTTTFPTLRLELLWPMTRPNDSNRPEPGFPFGRFPYGDKFVSACLARNAAPEHILDLATNGKWGANWPDLDEAFRTESRRLTTDDTIYDVKIGAHVLKRFRSQRLFWTVDHPTDVLISELAKRLLAATGLFPDAAQLVDEAFTPAETGGVLGIYAVPIHPYVAAHFALAWYRPDQTYQVYDRTFTYAQYFEALIGAATRTAG